MSEIDVSNLKVFFEKNVCNHCKDTLDCDCEQCPKYDRYKKAEKIITQLQQLKAENEELRILNKANADNYVKWRDRIEAENEELKEIRENLHKCNKKIMDEKHNISIKNIKYKQCLDEIFENIEYIEATAERIDDDNCIPLAFRIVETSRNILQIIKQTKEVEE